MKKRIISTILSLSLVAGVIFSNSAMADDFIEAVAGAFETDAETVTYKEEISADVESAEPAEEATESGSEDMPAEEPVFEDETTVVEDMDSTVTGLAVDLITDDTLLLQADVEIFNKYGNTAVATNYYELGGLDLCGNLTPVTIPADVRCEDSVEVLQYVNDEWTSIIPDQVVDGAVSVTLSNLGMTVIVAKFETTEEMQTYADEQSIVVRDLSAHIVDGIAYADPSEVISDQNTAENVVSDSAIEAERPAEGESTEETVEDPEAVIEDAEKNIEKPAEETTVTGTAIVTFIGYDNEVIATETYEVGMEVSFPSVPEVEGYEFAGWDITDTVVTGDITYTALYKEVAIKEEKHEHEISYVSNGDGTHTKICTVDGCDYQEVEDCQYEEKKPFTETVTDAVVAEVENVKAGFAKLFSFLGVDSADSAEEPAEKAEVEQKENVRTCLLCGTAENGEKDRVTLIAQTKEFSFADRVVTVSGYMPEGCIVTCSPVTKISSVAKTLEAAANSDLAVEEAFDITVYNVDGTLFQPVDYGEKLSITITNTTLDEEKDAEVDEFFAKDYEVYRVDDKTGETTALEVKIDGNITDYNTLTFETEHFTTFVVGSTTYNASDATATYTAGDSITAYWYEDSGVLAFIGSGVMTDFTSSSAVPWENLKAEIAGVYIKSGITNIGKYAFSGCTSLTSIVIPDSVASIGISAFYSCESLAAISIPESVTTIGNLAFGLCSSLSSITIPNSVTNIGMQAFIKCTSLTSVVIPDSVTSIGHSAFIGCPSLETITVNVNNTTYDSRNNCNAIIETSSNTLIRGCKNTIIPDSVTSIGEYAFADSESLTFIAIPDGVTTMEKGAFSRCTSLISIIIPGSVTTIGSNAFSGCTSLTSTIIPDGVTTIADDTFNNCTSLASIVIPDSVTAIGVWAFAGCASLTSITIPDSVTTIEDMAFWFCSSLTSITIPDSVTTIGDIAFYTPKPVNTKRITEKTVAQSYDWAGDNRYILCMEWNIGAATETDIIASLYTNGETTAKYNLVLTGTGQVKNMTSNSSSAVPWYSYRSDIVSISIGDGITSCASSTSYAFYGMPNVKDLTIPIDCRAGYNSNTWYNTAPTNVSFTKGVNGVGYTYTSSTAQYTPWYKSARLKTVEFDEGIRTIGPSTFYNCDKTYFTSVVLPESLATINSYAFSGCSHLTTISVGNNVTYIDSTAFYVSNFTTTTVITNNSHVLNFDWISSNRGPRFQLRDTETAYKAGDNLYALFDESTGMLRFFGDSAMYDFVTAPWDEIKTSVTSIALDRATTIGANAFSGFTKVKSITIPLFITSIGTNAFYVDATLKTQIYTTNSMARAYDWASDNRKVVFTSPALKTYEIGASNAPDVVATYYADGTLKIEGTGVMQNFSSDAPWYSDGNYSNIKKVTIGSGITTIGNYAFYQCSSLTDVTISGTVTSIGESAFENCFSLTTINLSIGVTTIGNSAFKNANQLAAIKGGKRISSVGTDAFEFGGAYGSKLEENGNYLNGLSWFWSRWDNELGIQVSTEAQYRTAENIGNFQYGTTSYDYYYSTDSDTEFYNAVKACDINGDGTVTVAEMSDELKAMPSFSAFEANTISGADSSYLAQNGFDHENMLYGISYGYKIQDTSVIVPEKYKHTTLTSKASDMLTGYDWADDKRTLDEIVIDDSEDVYGSWEIGTPIVSDITASLYKKSDGTYRLEITGEGDMKDFASGTNNWGSSVVPWLYRGYSYNVSEIIISEGITCIGASAFEQVTNTTTIAIPDSVTSIHEKAFYGSGVHNIKGGKNLVNIAADAFLWTGAYGTKVSEHPGYLYGEVWFWGINDSAGNTTPTPAEDIKPENIGNYQYGFANMVYYPISDTVLYDAVKACDLDGNGRASGTEIIDALKATAGYSDLESTALSAASNSGHAANGITYENSLYSIEYGWKEADTSIIIKENYGRTVLDKAASQTLRDYNWAGNYRTLTASTYVISVPATFELSHQGDNSYKGVLDIGIKLMPQVETANLTVTAECLAGLNSADGKHADLGVAIDQTNYAVSDCVLNQETGAYETDAYVTLSAELTQPGTYTGTVTINYGLNEF